MILAHTYTVCFFEHGFIVTCMSCNNNNNNKKYGHKVKNHHIFTDGFVAFNLDPFIFR